MNLLRRGLWPWLGILLVLGPFRANQLASGQRAGCGDPGSTAPIVVVGGPLTPRADLAHLTSVMDSVPDVSAWSFPWNSARTEWREVKSHAKSLAEFIRCLADASASGGGAGKVGIVAHSLGGLSTRLASAQSIVGEPVRDDIAAVATIATPHQGSWIPLAYAKTALQDGVLHLLNSACGRKDRMLSCSLSETSRGTDAFAVASQEIAGVPRFDEALVVLAIGSEARLSSQLFGPPFALPGGKAVGDGVADTASATRYEDGGSVGQHPEEAGGTVVIACNTLLTDLVVPTRHPLCLHDRLLVEEKVLTRLKAFVAQAQQTSLAPPPPPEPVYSCVANLDVDPHACGT